jgi:serine/threonine-protein kinase ULK2
LEKEEFVIKIADFGFARHLEDRETAESGCGTPLMMAPEVL